MPPRSLVTSSVGGFLVTPSVGKSSPSSGDFILRPPPSQAMRASSPAISFSCPSWAIRGPRPVSGGLWMGNLPHVVFTGPKPTRDSKIRPRSAERGFQNHRARAPCSCSESLCHERLPWPAVCPLGGVLPEPHGWRPLKVHVPSGGTVLAMMSPHSLELSSLMGGPSCLVGLHSFTGES